MPNYMKEAGMDYGKGGSKKKKMPSYGHGGGMKPKMKMYKKGGSLGITPTSLPGGCGGKRKK